MKLPPPAPLNRVLLVEGRDDEEIVRRLRDRHQQVPAFSILDKRGYPSLRDSIVPEIQAPGRHAVGILVDANDDLSARWQSVADRLREGGHLAPSSPDGAGTIIDGRPRIGIWLMPDNEVGGEVEEFVARMIPDADSVWPLSQRYVQGICTEHRKFKEKKIRRAQVHAWLATRKDPRQMGLAIAARDLEVNGVLCQRFVDWLTRLFS